MCITRANDPDVDDPFALESILNHGAYDEVPPATETDDEQEEEDETFVDDTTTSPPPHHRVVLSSSGCAETTTASAPTDVVAVVLQGTQEGVVDEVSDISVSRSTCEDDALSAGGVVGGGGSNGSSGKGTLVSNPEFLNDDMSPSPSPPMIEVEACLVDEGAPNRKNKNTSVLNVIKDSALGGAGVGAAAVAANSAAGAGLACAGFTTTGIAANSVAASMMSSAAIANGGGVAAGSSVAVLQSFAANGAILFNPMLGVAIGTVAVGAYGAKKLWDMHHSENNNNNSAQLVSIQLVEDTTITQSVQE